jgi:hypothetical protein
LLRAVGLALFPATPWFIARTVGLEHSSGDVD